MPDQNQKIVINVSDLNDEDKQQLDLLLKGKAGGLLDANALNSKGADFLSDSLNEVSPGLGPGARTIAGMFAKPGPAAATGEAAGVGEIAAGAEAVEAINPLLLAVGLTIQATMGFWDLYQEKVKAVAAANDQAMQQMVDATHAARKAVEDLNDVLTPKQKDLATQDEDALKKQLRDLDAAGAHQKAVNQVNEQRELDTAASPEQKKQIQEQYQQKDEDLNESQQLKKALAEAAAGDQVGKQIAEIKQVNEQLFAIQAKTLRDKKKADDEIDTLTQSKADATYTVHTTIGNLQVDDEVKKAAINREIATLRQVQADADTTFANATANYDDLKKAAGRLGDMQEQFKSQTQEDRDAWAQMYETDQAVAAVRKQGDAERPQAKVTAETSGPAGPASTAQSAAENNNASQSLAEAQAAYRDAKAAITTLQTALKATTDAHREANAAILQAFANLTAEDQMLARKMREHNWR